MDDLDALLHDAAAADPATRMEFRDRIAAFGSEAIKRLGSWVSDPRLGAFAVRTIERAAAMPGTAAVAKLTLQKADATGRTRDDVVSALSRLRVQARRSASTGSRPGPTGDTKRSRTKDEVFRSLRDLLAENACRRQLMAYSETGLNRNVVGKLLDDINRSEHEQGRPLL